MIDLVHYLVGQPARKSSLVYPIELYDENYVGFGDFYLLGKAGTEIGDLYSFYAIRGGQIVPTTLMPYRGSKSFFQVEVSGIGDFVFYAQPLSFKPPYAGGVVSAKGLVALRRLCSWQPQELNRACLEKDFYFVGYSPRI